MADGHQDPYNQPISITDATCMLKRNVQRNDPPYQTAVIKLNNALVDEWKRKVLMVVADGKNTIPAGRVHGSWKLFDEGRSIKKYMELKEKGMFPDVAPEVIEFWKDFFEKLTVEEMHEYGASNVATGWTILQDHMRRWYAKERWERLYSQAPDDPLFWEKNHHAHSMYMEGKILPFWDRETFVDVNQKVRTILQVQVAPKG